MCYCMWLMLVLCHYYIYAAFSLHSYISWDLDSSLMLPPSFLPALVCLLCLLSLLSPLIHPPLSTPQSGLQAKWLGQPTSFVLSSDSLLGSEVRGPQIVFTAAPWCSVLSTVGGIPLCVNVLRL